MSKLIALVAVALLLKDESTKENVRTEIAPGEPIPDGVLSEHDITELKKMGSIEDQDEVAAAEKRQGRADAAANADFEKERKAVAAANASTVSPTAKKR